MSLTLTDSSFDKVLHFETYLNERHKHMKFVALLDAQTVVELGFDAPARHQHYIGSLPPGIPNDWRAYKYAKFLDVQNRPVYFGVPWVKGTSITEDDTAPYIITVWGVDNNTMNSIRSMLVANGVEKFEISRP